MCVSQKLSGHELDLFFRAESTWVVFMMLILLVDYYTEKCLEYLLVMPTSDTNYEEGSREMHKED